MTSLIPVKEPGVSLSAAGIRIHTCEAEERELLLWWGLGYKSFIYNCSKDILIGVAHSDWMVGRSAQRNWNVLKDCLSYG